MDSDKEKLVSTNTEYAPHQLVVNYTGHFKMSDTGSCKSYSSGTKTAEVVYNTAGKPLPVYILTPVNTNTVKSHFISPNILFNTSSGLTDVHTPYHINATASQQSVRCVSVINDGDLKRAAVQQNVPNVSQESAITIVTALFQNITGPIPLENTEPEYSEIQKTIDDISHVVERIFATSSEGILVTFPCTPGFENEKVGPSDRIIVKRGSKSSFGLCDECELEKKFNIIFHYMSADVLSTLSTESEIKRIICNVMNALMDVMPVEHALTLVCNCSLCWFLYMCAKVIYRDSPEGLCKLNWSGCSISSYRCLAMRRIAIMDVKSEAGVGQDSGVLCRSSLQIRFTRFGQKRRPYKQSEQLKSVKRRMGSRVPDLNKVSKVIIRTCDNADVIQSVVSPGSGLNNTSQVTGRICDIADVASCSFNSMKPGQSKNDTGLKFRGWSRSWNPEDDLHVFNPVRQFKGNTYTRRKNSSVR
jgi:hypothetical protein